METIYFVSWYIHNKEENVWNGTIVDQYTDYSAAKKAYHTQLSMYIDDPKFDCVSVILTDNYGATRMSECWDIRVAPQPPEENGSN